MNPIKLNQFLQIENNFFFLSEWMLTLFSEGCYVVMSDGRTQLAIPRHQTLRLKVVQIHIDSVQSSHGLVCIDLGGKVSRMDLAKELSGFRSKSCW